MSAISGRYEEMIMFDLLPHFPVYKAIGEGGSVFFSTIDNLSVIVLLTDVSYFEPFQKT